MQPFPFSPQRKTRWTLALPAALLILAILSCNVSVNDEAGLQQTQAAIGIQQTVLAQQNSNTGATQTAQQALRAVPTTQAPPDIPATQNALAAVQTATSQVVAPIMVETAIPPAVQPSPQPPQPPQPQQPQQPGPGFNEWMKTAQILVYEDIVADPSLAQYVKKALDGMGLQYKWDGNAMGRFKSDLLGGASNGQPWDLIIVAVEWRENISGEYFEYLNNSLNQGSSVILEAFHLDDISEGTVSTILNHCGVTVYPYIPDSGSVNDAILWPLPGASTHPVLTNPNAGMRFTNALDTWLWSFDLGSLMAVTGGDAQLLLGTKGQDAYQDGALTVCLGGQLILQTFSSHSFPYSTMGPLWENYITNALAKRHQGQ